VTPQDYDHLCKLLHARSGLVLAADKHYLVESRLLPIARRTGLVNLTGLVARLREPGAEALICEVVEAMTTNETFFFRDRTPFENFRNVMLPALMERRSPARRIRIWCAAASTGQEPYSLAMMLREMGRELRGWRFEIVATDLSSEVIERARAGVYSQFEVQRGLPVAMLIKYFAQTGDRWQIAPEIRDMVRFMPLNLLHDVSQLGVFDIVFCRNVLIYFDQPTKIAVLERIAGATEPDGFLALGAAETVVGLTEAFRPVAEARGLYAPTGAPVHAASPLQARSNVISFAGSIPRVKAASGPR
jgi:chemotaxis protein methyltransferase CheR